jgi:hypothetical protein
MKYFLSACLYYGLCVLMGLLLFAWAVWTN